ncbi:SAM-dependent methyltransferase [Kutzneria sp. CA-103260]|uniref:SAM-dependent methyltransferase n=1 Tax=Kutzneria sp. CA-103260 TaxID=2802641 RepID=UPI001BAD8428|nr:SAM-dependent methyltransferase [Kutzneria sp. CA-103260]QUQ71684.1 SAM-dependent methyltransferase [Kutzneria sp. CA-103260]
MTNSARRPGQDGPSDARLYDVMLGGGNNFQSDRTLADEVLRDAPGIRAAAIASRRFLREATLHMLGHGIDQFLDLGCGVLAAGSVHELAPDGRVVYVDRDEVATAHCTLTLRGKPGVQVLTADVCHVHRVLGSAAVRETLDLTRPVGVFMTALPHFILDEQDPAAVIGGYRDAMVPGSMVALTHLTEDLRPEEVAAFAKHMAGIGSPFQARPHAEVLTFFDGFDLASPGLVLASNWPDRVDGPGSSEAIYAGLGRKR